MDEFHYEGWDEVSGVIRWPVAVNEVVCKPKEKGRLINRPLIAGAGFEPAAFGL
jgi:hypothetical protein